MSREEEKQFLIAARDMVEVVTGQRPIGYNCNWLRRDPNTLSLLQELGYIYHVDDLSRSYAGDWVTRLIRRRGEPTIL